MAAAHAAALGQRIAARDHEDRHVIGARVQEPHHRVGEPHVHMHRGRRHFPGRKKVAMRHRHHDVFVCRGYGFGYVDPTGLGIRFDNRREVRAGINEQSIHPIRFQ